MATKKQTQQTPDAPRVIGTVPKKVSLQILALAKLMHEYQASIDYMGEAAGVLPAGAEELREQLEQLRGATNAARLKVRIELITLAWDALEKQSGIRRGQTVILQYRDLGVLDLDCPQFVVREEQLYVSGLTVSGPTPEDFRFCLEGFRLLKNGKPGKTEVNVEVRSGLKVTLLADSDA